ncbi:helix-turn-helix transcriptional regulator [Candidatus Acetothermia bacterium]|nr:helix-turn-helix transcriptional regulator [Candidatus Acetothermia bacterium]
MMVHVQITGEGILVRFADGATGTIPLRDLKLKSKPVKIELPDPYVILLKLADGPDEEIPWDFARHNADPHYRERSEKAARQGLEVLGRRLQKLRARAGLSQAELANRSSLDRVTIARIELGEHSPRYATLLSLAKGLGVDVRRLLMD